MQVTQREADLLSSLQGRHCLKLLYEPFHVDHKYEIVSDISQTLLELGLEKATVMELLKRAQPIVDASGVVKNAVSIIVDTNKSEMFQFLDTFNIDNPEKILIDGDYINIIPIPSPYYLNSLFGQQSQVSLITAPIGSGKSTATANSISQAILESDHINSVLVICPRNKSCDQFVDLLKERGVDPGQFYGAHRNTKSSVVVTNFDKAPKLLHRTPYDWIIVDDFHALWDDNTFRRDQNNILSSALISALNRSSASIYFISATPRKGAMLSFYNSSIIEVKHYSYSTSKESKRVNFYRTKDTQALLIQMVLESDKRCIVHNNNIVMNAKIAAYLIERGKRVLQVHSNTKESFTDLLNYDCILVTNFIDSGFSINDGVPSKVFSLVSSNEGIIPIVQRIGRTRENVEEYIAIIKKRKYRDYPNKDVKNLQVWNCGWDFDQCDIPMHWSNIRNRRRDYLERNSTSTKSFFEGNYLNRILETPVLKELYNNQFASHIGFYIGEIYEVEAIPVELDIFVKEIREVFYELSSECDVLTLLTSLIQVAPSKVNIPDSINKLCSYTRMNNRFNGEIIDKLSTRLLERFGSRLIISDAFKEIVDLCVSILSTYSLDIETLKGLDVPTSIEEWFSADLKTRSKYIQRSQQALASLFAVADIDSPRPLKMDPIQFNVGKIFNRWIKYVVESDATSFTPKELEAFVDRFICKGYLPYHSGKYFANPNYLDRGKIYGYFKTSVRWICYRRRVGSNIYYDIDPTLLENFIILLKSLGVLWDRLEEEQFNLPSILRYNNDLRRNIILCNPLFQLVCDLI